MSIGELIKYKGLSYFGRFRFNQISPASTGEWNGLCLGSYAEADNQVKILEDLELLDENNVKINAMTPLKSHTCKMRGIDKNGSVVTLQSLHLSTETSGIVQINGTQISIDPSLWQPKTAIISATAKHLGVEYEMKAEIYAYPILLKKILTSIPDTVSENASIVNFALSGVSYDDAVLPNIQNEISASIFEAPWASIAAPGRLEIDRAAQIESGKDEFLIFWSWHGRLVDFTQVKLATRRFECLSATLSLDPESVHDLSNASLYISSTDKILAGAEYSISIRGFRDNAWETVSGAQIEDELKSPDVSILNEGGAWKLSSDATVDTPVMLKMTLSGCTSRELILVEPVRPTTLEIVQPNVIRAGATSSFSVKEVFEDGSKKDASNATLALAGGNPATISSIDGLNVTFNAISNRKESLCFKASTPDGIEKLFIVVITQ